MVSADALAISMYTIFINVAVTGEGNEVWNSLQGPLSIVFGALAGIAAAAICGPTRIWNTTLKRVLATLLLSEAPASPNRHLLPNYTPSIFAGLGCGAISSGLLQCSGCQASLPVNPGPDLDHVLLFQGQYFLSPSMHTMSIHLIYTHAENGEGRFILQL